MKEALYYLLLVADAIAAVLLARLVYRRWMKLWYDVTARLVRGRGKNNEGSE